MEVLRPDGGDDCLMNKTRRTPTTRTRCPTLFDKWRGVFYMPSCTDTAGHTRAFDYPVVDHWGKVKVLRHISIGRLRPVGPQSTMLTTRPHESELMDSGVLMQLPCRHGRGYLVVMGVDTLSSWAWLPCRHGHSYLIVMGVDTLSSWAWIPCRHGRGYPVVMGTVTLSSWARLPHRHGRGYSIVMGVDTLSWAWIPCYGRGYPVVMGTVTPSWARLPRHHGRGYPVVMGVVTLSSWAQLPCRHGHGYPVMGTVTLSSCVWLSPTESSWAIHGSYTG